ncbi:holo-[acyl-carrier protein] synthase [Sulfuritortus calidifontis]|uniref:Holo-[acyl-carrier-protein] synthase n=2 Tax=Sulfuritortus calidifontis TaxID=1914471 RepID=A0A4R3JY79_9PROT|nr:holo-ACP synthase [Sulfuritortus calidifontis]TCS73424.1 holo-[acyl-carrier protein] synthase [Sulfuritortus calidifontis]
MIFGIGTDLVVIERVRAMHARHGQRLAERMLAPAELPGFDLVPDKPRFLAKRFAAKEAFAKAAGTGMRAPLHLSTIGVRHNALGRPELFFSDELAAWLRRQGVVRSHLSLSDEQEHAMAFVVLESEAS